MIVERDLVLPELPGVAEHAPLPFSKKKEQNTYAERCQSDGINTRPATQIRFLEEW